VDDTSNSSVKCIDCSFFYSGVGNVTTQDAAKRCIKHNSVTIMNGPYYHRPGRLTAASSGRLTATPYASNHGCNYLLHLTAADI